MIFNIDIHKILVLRTDGPDIVFVHTDLPSSMPKVSARPLVLKFEAEADTGAEYAFLKFGITPEVIDSRRDRNV